MKLFRPIGLTELALISDTGNKGFPPRLDWQPIFYPVLNFAYAAQIAEEWNTIDDFSGYVGFVTEFEVADVFISKYEPQNVGGKIHNELWVPAEELEEMNRNIQGRIQIVAAYYGEKYEGKLQATQLFTGKNAKEQAAMIQQNPEMFLRNLVKEKHILLANFSYWKSHDLLTKELLVTIEGRWKEIEKDILLV